MRHTLATLLLSSTLLLVVSGGCNEEQLARIDQGIQDANHVVTAADRTVTDLADSPVGGLIPPQVYQIMELLGIGVTAALALWKTIRASGLLKKNSDLTVTLKALVDGVEASGDQAAPVKANIKEIMRDREVYSVANPIVDQVKARPAQKIS